MILCIWFLTTPLVPTMISFAGSRAGSVVVRFLIHSGVMLCLWFTVLLARGPGSTYVWRYAVFGVMLCCDVWRGFGDLKLSGVMLCCGAIDRRATTFSCALCIIYTLEINILIFFYMYYFLYIWFDYCSDLFLYLLLCILSTYFVLTPFSGGCVSCPQVRTHSLVIHLFRTPFLLFGVLLSFRSLYFWYIYLLVHLYIFVHGYGGALSRHMILSVCLEVCGHVCGLGSFCMNVCTCRLGDPIRRGGRSAYVVWAILYAEAAGPHMFIYCLVSPVWLLLVFSACRVYWIVRKTKETLPKFFWKLPKFEIKPCRLPPYTRMSW